MAKKAKEKIEEEETTTPESKEYVKERVDEFLEEKDKNIVEEKAEEIKEKEPPKEEKPSEPPPEPPKEEKPIEIDTTALKEELRQEVLSEIAASLTGQKPTPEDQTPWEKEGRNPRSYTEIAEYVADLAEKKQQRQQQEVYVQQEAQIKQSQEERKRVDAEYNKYWDEQLDELRAEGKLPKIENKEDEKDPGKVAQKQIFEQMYSFNIQRQQQGQAPIFNIKEFFAYNYKNPKEQPPGAEAPISGGRTSVGEGKSKEDYSYEEINKARTFHDLIGAE